MKTKPRVTRLKTWLIIATFATGSGAQLARAGETSVYIKSGWYNSDESVNGSSFVKEKGFMHGAGIARRDEVSAFLIAEFVEVWGGNLDYDGHDLTGEVPLKSTTSYLGTREEVAVGIQLWAGTLRFEPFAAVGHKFWDRSRSDEDWNSFYAKAGMAGEFKTTGGMLFVKGGALVPLYTREHVSFSGTGYTDVVFEPKSEISGFAEGGIKLGAFAVSFEYEGMKFGESAKASINKSTSGANGVVVQNTQAYQPGFHSSLYSLKLAFSF
jgi:hypothetical protein